MLRALFFFLLPISLNAICCCCDPCDCFCPREERCLIPPFRPPPFKKYKIPAREELPLEGEALKKGLITAPEEKAFEPIVSSIPRTVLALYDAKIEPDIFFTYIHQFAEMPLNHFGVKVQYHDINLPLPKIDDQKEIIGVITWFHQGVKLKDPEKYIRWAIKAVEAGKKYVILGDPGFYTLGFSFDSINLFLKKLGIFDTGYPVAFTYDAEFAFVDPVMMNFERKYTGFIPGFSVIKVILPDVKEHVVVQKRDNPNSRSSVITTSPRGAYVAGDFAIFEIYESERSFRRWYLNPFLFFKTAFQLPDVPMPDTTTIAGRRIYYSHIDGDGWTNETELVRFQQNPPLSPEVIMSEVIKPNPDLPVTVGPIAANLDLEWNGKPLFQDIAKRIFLLPQVETGCHTFSHPFDWGFFNNYKKGDEEGLLDLYPNRGWKPKRFLDTFKITWSKNETFYELQEDQAAKKPKETTTQHEAFEELRNRYRIPRAYATKPFDLNLEVLGAIKVVNQFAPQDKKVVLYQWSGDCLPNAKAIALTREAKVRNINGGDTRFDNTSDSYAWVRPISRQLENQIQVYASASNENLYTHLWKSDFYGFINLTKTFENTDSPIRIKPINLYYHMYSGEKQPGVSAIQKNIEFIRKQNIAPITASHFAAIVDGFYSTKIEELSDNRFRIVNRGHMQTFRLDNAVFRSVDFERSKGVIGQRHLQGSLYIYLDHNVQTPIIALKDVDQAILEPESKLPYLIESRWLISNLQNSSDGLQMQVYGWGKGEMRWRVPEDGVYEIAFGAEKKLTAQAVNGILDFVVDATAIKPENLRIKKKMQDR